ncbi:hypothetical protein [Prauserella halophila]|uniref:hypothetical protein n=1 Tax=Prauserella halophila TaxID=185641 RepID=UPI0020A28508|nr:hypothetical protein [Prauserella halophila]MCP2234604.1 hypothetical protein [Prauserella halophila]
MSRNPLSAERQAQWLALARKADKMHARQVENLAHSHRSEIASHLAASAAGPELRAQISAIQARVDGQERVSEEDKLLAAGMVDAAAGPDHKREQLIRARHAVRFAGTEQNT